MRRTHNMSCTQLSLVTGVNQWPGSPRWSMFLWTSRTRRLRWWRTLQRRSYGAGLSWHPGNSTSPRQFNQLSFHASSSAKVGKQSGRDVKLWRFGNVIGVITSAWHHVRCEHISGWWVDDPIFLTSTSLKKSKTVTLIQRQEGHGQQHLSQRCLGAMTVQLCVRCTSVPYVLGIHAKGWWCCFLATAHPPPT